MRTLFVVALVLFLVACEGRTETITPTPSGSAQPAAVLVSTATLPVPSATVTAAKTPFPTPTPLVLPPTPVPYKGPLKPGVWAEVTGTGSCLNIRVAPSLASPAVACRPDSFWVQVMEGPEEQDGHRWWRIAGEVPSEEKYWLFRSLIKGWAAEDFLRPRLEGVLTFRGLSVGDQVGDLTVGLTKGYARTHLPYEVPFLNFSVHFSGETMVTGRYSWDECGWAFFPDEESRPKLPRLADDPKDAYWGIIFANQKETSAALAPGIAEGQEHKGLRGMATIVISNYVLVRYPTSCAQSAVLVRVLQQD